jgi:hypothetical protein
MPGGLRRRCDTADIESAYREEPHMNTRTIAILALIIAVVLLLIFLL